VVRDAADVLRALLALGSTQDAVEATMSRHMDTFWPPVTPPPRAWLEDADDARHYDHAAGHFDFATPLFERKES
jgi:hypothetical protein